MLKDRTKEGKLMLSRSFLKGFGRGLVAPGLLLEPYKVKRESRYNATVEQAWDDVGRALRDAMSMEGALSGKKASITRYSRRKHRQAAE